MPEEPEGAGIAEERGDVGQKTRGLPQSLYFPEVSSSCLTFIRRQRMLAARHLLPGLRQGLSSETQNGQAQGAGRADVTENGVRKGGYVCSGKVVSKGGGV